MDRVVIEDWKAFFGQWRESGLSQKGILSSTGDRAFPGFIITANDWQRKKQNSSSGSGGDPDRGTCY
jgi:hypothetical protein